MSERITQEDYSNRIYSNRKVDKSTYNSNRSIAIEEKYTLTKNQEDNILESLVKQGVIDNNYRLYFITHLRRLGPTKLLEYADKAIKYGSSPQRYFTSLCKRDI